MKFAIRKVRAALVLAMVFMAGMNASKSQTVSQVTATNPKYPEFYDPPYQSQLKQLIQGAKAESLPGDSKIQISEAKVQTFQTNGQTELVIEAPQCVYDRVGRCVNSAGPLHAQTGDGKFIIDGTGFLWLQTNATLLISNRVHTFVQSELLQSRGTNAATAAATKVGDLEIASQSFFLDVSNSLANYFGDAKVSSTNLSLAGGSIVIIAPIREKQLHSITVQTNVVMDYEKVRVEGGLATYAADTGLARVRGHPQWRSEEREGKADELIVDPAKKVFRGNGQAYLKFSALTLSNAAFIPSQKHLATTNTAVVTNRIVEISSDFYEFHTNSASFGDHVSLNETANGQPHGSLNCGSLNVTFTGTNELQSMVAEKNVVIQQETNRLAGDIATYSAASGDLELKGKPSWQRGQQEGKGNSIVINPRSEKMFVKGDASMRLPAKDLGDPARIAPAPDQPVDTAGLDKAMEFAEVYADEYAFTPSSARFDGNVRIIHPRMNWSCNKLGVDSVGSDGKNVTMLAEGSVVFALSTENHPPLHGACDLAQYVHNLTVQPVVDRMEMTGHPIIETTNAVVRNAIIILDNEQQKVFLPGEYAMSGKGNLLGTNAFRLVPK